MTLEVREIHAFYGKGHILQGVSLGVKASNIVGLLGRNGSGRSTTLKVIMGVVKPAQGSVALNGIELAGKSPTEISRAGIAYVPEDRLVFPNLSVEENLSLGQQQTRPDLPAWKATDVFEYFPRLKERRQQKAGTLSGGEQQMLTVSRSLLGNPHVILVDEPTEGLAPKIVENIREVLLDIRRRGVAVLLVEQKLVMALQVSDQVAVMGHGKVVFSGTPDELKQSPDVRKAWLDVA